MQIQRAISSAAKRLEKAGQANGRSEAIWMLAELLELSVASIVHHGDDELSSEQNAAFEEMLRRREQGEPLQYILGNVDFYTINLHVGPGVLIPRPETEELVELALKNMGESGHVLDLCTGSGAIALALAHERPQWEILATDVSDEALVWAEQNRARLAMTNVKLAQGDLFEAVPQNGVYELITANPPYVNPADYAGLDAVVRDYEPKLALVAEERGLAITKRIAQGALAHLAAGGMILCEIGDEQGAEVRAIFEMNGYRDVVIHQDLTHQDRIVSARRQK